MSSSVTVSKPAVASHNIQFVGHSDMTGRSDGVQVMVHRGYAYVGHTFSNGITFLHLAKPTTAPKGVAATALLMQTG